MSNLQNSPSPVNGTAQESPQGRPSWLAELRAETRALREEASGLREDVQGLRAEVRSLRGETDPERNLAVEEAAEIAGISRRKLDTLIAEGSVPSLKIGRRRLIPNRAFRAWLRRRAEGGAK